MSGEKKKVFKNLFSVGVIQVVNYIFPMITIPIVSRIIGPDRLGVINFTASFMAYFILLISYGFSTTATRRIAVDQNNIERRNKVFSEVFTTQSFLLIISTVIFCFSLFFVPQLREEKTVAIFTFITCFSTVLTQNWLFQAMQNLSKIAILNFVSKVIFTIVILLTIRKKDDYIWQPLALSLSLLIVSVISFFWSIKLYKLKLYRVKISDCVKLLKDERVYFISLCVIYVYTNTNIVMLGFLQSSSDVGFYTAGQKLISIVVSVITIPLRQTFFPYVGKAFGESYQKGITVAQQLFPPVFIFTFISGLIIFICSPLFISLFYGSAFEPAVEVCRILAFIPMIISVCNIWGIQVMLNLKMDKIYLRVTCIGAAFSIALNFILIKRMGFIGAACTWTLTELLNVILVYVFLKKKGVNVINISYFSFNHYLQFFNNFNLVKFKKNKI